MFFLKSFFCKYYTLLFLFASCFFYSCKSGKEIAKTENKTETSSLKKIQKKYATLLNVDEKKIINTKLYILIDDWYGTPYKFGGTDKNGIDCSDFVTTLYMNIYKKQLICPVSKIYSMCQPVAMPEIQEGDLVFFKIDGNKISHVGVYLQNNKFVHASTKKGIIIEDLNQEYYKKYFFKAGRLKN